MKRFLSWIVLYLISIIVSLLTSLAIGFGAYLLALAHELNTFLKIIIYIFGGSTVISLIFVPAIYGSFLSVAASEAIRGTKKGTRYYVIATYMLLSNIIYVVIGLTNNALHLNAIIMCVYYILLIIWGRNAALENWTKYEKSPL